jgi:AmiR/NasT family two-component response regulator
MAMGVLMGRGGVTRDEAFTLLRQAAQHLCRKLREVAADVVETGHLPG